MSDWTDGLEVQGPGDTPTSRKRVVRRAAVASALIAGLGAAGYGVASAVSAGSSSAAASAPATTVARSSAGASFSSSSGRWGFGEGAPPAASGIVTSLGSNTFTLKTTSGTSVTVDVSSTTTYRDRGVTSPSFANVSVNEHVAVFGTTSSGTVSATSVLIGGAGGHVGFGEGAPPAASGIVTSLGSNTFTLKTTSGTSVTVDVSSTTTYRDRGVTSPSFANVSVNEHVAVFGTTSSGTVSATSVLIGGAGGHVGFGEGAPPAASGIVTSLGSNTFTLKTTSGTSVTVDVSSTTTYRDRGVTSPSFANVSVNEHVAVFGTTSSGTVSATSVEIGTEGGHFGHGYGGWNGAGSGAGGGTGSTV